MYITKIFLYASADRAVKHKRVLLTHRNVRKSALRLRIDLIRQREERMEKYK